jgi:ring-1,2-phenylacetyl-CoA epoxidase subunit PaaA
VNQTVKQAEYLGLTVPDKNLKWNEEKKGYDFSEPDWKEFKNVINGNGPCNKERLASRNKAHKEGEWVRAAAAAYGKKQMQEKSAA